MIANPSFHLPVPSLGPPESTLNFSVSFKPQFPPVPSCFTPQYPFARDFLVGPAKQNFAWVLSAPSQGFSGLLDPQKVSLIGELLCSSLNFCGRLLKPKSSLLILSIELCSINLFTTGIFIYPQWVKMQNEKSYVIRPVRRKRVFCALKTAKISVVARMFITLNPLKKQHPPHCEIFH